MKYNLLIQQKVIVDNNLKIDLVDACILLIISDMPSSSKIEKKYEGNVVFFWVNHLNLAKENPILGIKTADGIYRRMVKMSELGLIIIHPNNKQSKKSFYAITDLTNALFNSDEKPKSSDLLRIENRSDIGLKTEVTSDEKPKDYTIKDNTINDNIHIGSKSKKIKPTLNDVVEYFKEKGYNYDYAKMAFDYYDSADWHDAKGSKVVNWKQKMLVNWINQDRAKNYKIESQDLFSKEQSSGLKMVY